ncbi:MAG: recombinase family protein [Caldilinea sp.]
MQADALQQAGCKQVFSDQMSGAKAEQPGLQEAFSFVRKGDTLIVWRLERLGRSLKDLVQRVEELQQCQVGFRSLHESIDTTSSVGKFQFCRFATQRHVRKRVLAL